MKAPPFKASLLHPKHWPTWLAVGLLRVLCVLPIAAQIAIGEALGMLTGRLLTRRRDVVRINLKLCFPEISEAGRETLVDAHFKALGVGVFEAGLAWWASDTTLRARGDVIGLEHLQDAFASGQGVILLTGHFTTLEIGARYVAFNHDFHVMYRPYSNPVADWFLHYFRQRGSRLPALARDELRPLVRALREGRAIWYAPDQTLDPKHSVFVPFFGVATQTITGTSRLASMGRAKVVPYFPSRENGRWRVTFLPALENFPTDDEHADAARVSAVIEQGVRMTPAQYFWVHRRFKYRPPGEPNIY